MSSVFTSGSPQPRRSRSMESEVLMDYRERRALEALERSAAKQRDCEEQYSPQNSAEVRIRAWEKVHGLRMPDSPHHPVLDAIATATQLSLDEVRHEQHLRLTRRASAAS